MFAESVRYLEDYEVGQTFGTGVAKAEADRMKSFAAEFDPQPFHLSEDGAAGTIFTHLAGSGWYTAAMTMRLLVEGELKPTGGVIGLGFDELRWPKPVRAGDVLSVQSEILDVRPSKSLPGQGLIKVRTTTTNQKGETVQVSVGNLLVRGRASGSSRHEENDP